MAESPSHALPGCPFISGTRSHTNSSHNPTASNMMHKKQGTGHLGRLFADDEGLQHLENDADIDPHHVSDIWLADCQLS